MDLLVDELLHPIHIPALPLARRDSLFRHVTQRGVSNVEQWFSTRDEMLAASALNRRGRRELPTELSEKSALNVRYAEATRKPDAQYAPAAPSVTRQDSANATPRGHQRQLSTTSGVLDVSVGASTYPGNNIPPIFSKSIADQDLSRSLLTSPSTVVEETVNGDVKLSRGSHLNRRYMTEEATSISSNSVLNQRYLQTPTANGVANGRAGGKATPAHGRYVKNPKTAKSRQQPITPIPRLDKR